MSGVRFLLNGEPRAEAGVPPSMTVLDWLRTVARLTGTKEGCAEGDCGACTIVLGRPANGGVRYEAVNSCLMLLPQLDGCAVLTVEGLARGDALHPVQQALIDMDATQCGFCTSGFVMAMFAFREGGEPATDANIHEALAGNLCRCTGYRSIVDACKRLGHTPFIPAQAGIQESHDDNRAMRPLGPRFRGDERNEAESGAGTEFNHGDQIFLAPHSLDVLLAAREQHPDALLLAGGTDLGLRASKDREAFPIVISTMGVAELQRIAVVADALEIGAAATYSAALPHLDEHFTALAALVRRIGSRQIRNLGTFAGNLATASPIGDTLPCLIALGASVTLASRKGSRTLPVEDFITGYRSTALAPGEVIAGVRLPLLSGRHFHAYKLSKRFDQDIATVVAAFSLALDNGQVRDLRAAFGGMASRPMRASHLEKALIGRAWTQDSLADVNDLIARDFNPISDHRGGATYRLRAAAGLVRRLQLESTSSAPVRLEAL